MWVNITLVHSSWFVPLVRSRSNKLHFFYNKARALGNATSRNTASKWKAALFSVVVSSFSLHSAVGKTVSVMRAGNNNQLGPQRVFDSVKLELVVMVF